MTSQAKVATEAGSADVEFLNAFPPDTSAPAAPLPPVLPETGQCCEIVPFEAKVPEPITPIDYADFVAQTVLATARLYDNPPPVKSASASQPTLRGVRIIKNEGGMTYGSVFCTDNPTDSLYQMFANMAGKTAPDPYELEKRAIDEKDRGRPLSLKEIAKHGAVTHIPAEEAFARYIRVLWNMLQEITNGHNVNDFILHRAAYAFVMDEWEEVNITECASPDLLVAYAKRNPAKPYKPMVGRVKDLYLALGYGWSEKLLTNQATWQAEKVLLGDSGPNNKRRNLFPSAWKDFGNLRRNGGNIRQDVFKNGKRYNVAPPALPAAGLQIRTDAAHKETKPEPKKQESDRAAKARTLQNLSPENLRNIFYLLRLQSPKQYEEALTLLTPEQLAHLNVKTAAEREAERETDIKAAMASADKANAEAKAKQEERQMKKNLGWRKTLKPIKQYKAHTFAFGRWLTPKQK